MSQLCPNIDSNICRSCEFRETCNVNAANQTATWGSINGDIQLQKDLQGVLSVLRAYVDAAISTLRDELLGKDTITKNMLRAEFRTLLDDNSVSVGKRFVALESGLQKQIVDLRDIDIAGMREMVIPVRDGFVTLNKDIGTMLDNRIVVAKTDMTKEFDAKFDAKETVLRGSIDDITADMATYKSGFDASLGSIREEMTSVKGRVGTIENAEYQTKEQVQTALNGAKTAITSEYTQLMKTYSDKIDGDITSVRGSLDSMDDKVGTLTATVNTNKSGLDAVKSRVGTLENAGYQTAAQVQTAMSTKLADYATTSSLVQFKTDMETIVNSAVYRGQWSGNSIAYKKNNTVVCGVTVGTGPMSAMSMHIHKCIKDHTSAEADLFTNPINKNIYLNANLWEDLGVTYNDYQQTE